MGAVDPPSLCPIAWIIPGITTRLPYVVTAIALLSGSLTSACKFLFRAGLVAFADAPAGPFIERNTRSPAELGLDQDLGPGSEPGTAAHRSVVPADILLCLPCKDICPRGTSLVVYTTSYPGLFPLLGKRVGLNLIFTSLL